MQVDASHCSLLLLFSNGSVECIKKKARWVFTYWINLCHLGSTWLLITLQRDTNMSMHHAGVYIASRLVCATVPLYTLTVVLFWKCVPANFKSNNQQTYPFSIVKSWITMFSEALKREQYGHITLSYTYHISTSTCIKHCHFLLYPALNNRTRLCMQDWYHIKKARSSYTCDLMMDCGIGQLSCVLNMVRVIEIGEISHY